MNISTVYKVLSQSIILLPLERETTGHKLNNNRNIAPHTGIVIEISGVVKVLTLDNGNFNLDPA